jgi:esterase/lipase superfamily enzyme
LSEIAAFVDVHTAAVQLLLDWADARSADHVSLVDIDELFGPEMLRLVFDPLSEAQDKKSGPTALARDEELEYQRRFATPVAQVPMAGKLDMVFDPALASGRLLRRIKVFFGTNRADGGGDHRSKHFANAPGDGLRLGVANVTLPPDHEQGQMERPWALLVRFEEDQRFHIVVESAQLLEEAKWRELAMTDLGGEDEAILFVHGYNVTFDDAVRRTAQLANDLKLSCMPLCFSWASAAQLFAYAKDEDTIMWSREHLRAFMDMAMRTVGLRRLHVIAHSMGNRALLEVISGLCQQQVSLESVGRVVLAAPDVATPIFRQHAQNFAMLPGVTLYASRGDWAIRASKVFHVGDRASDADPPLVLNHLETVDVTKACDGIFDLGHGYIASASKVFADLYEVIKHGTPAAKRQGTRVAPGGGYYEL